MNNGIPTSHPSYDPEALDGKNDPRWYKRHAGTIRVIIFAIVVGLVFLAIALWVHHSETHNGAFSGSNGDDHAGNF